MPGRSTDLSEGGLGVMVAGELIPGQPVAIELRLPNVAPPIRARAQVRYHDRLRYGLQFIGLSLEQLEMIRYWAAHAPLVAQQKREQKEREAAPAPAPAAFEATALSERRVRGVRVRPRKFLALLVFVLALAAFGWWEWQKAWNQLEDLSFDGKAGSAAVPLRVPSEVMDQQILYKVDPVYPESARAAGTEGLVVLDALITADGSVKRVRPITGSDVLTQAAAAAIQAWRYTPYHKDGRAVEAETTVSVDFRLR